MNFFSKWGKSKISNKSTEQCNSSSVRVDNNSSLTKFRTNVRNIYRRKNLNMTRSLFYDTENIDKMTDAKMKKAQSCNDLDCFLDEEYSAKNIQSITNEKNEMQELKSSSGLKKFFSLENLTQKDEHKGKRKHLLTKNMISEPSTSLQKISEEINEATQICLKETSKLVSMELEEKSSESVVDVKRIRTDLRKSRSLENISFILESTTSQPLKLVNLKLEQKSSENVSIVKSLKSKLRRSRSMESASLRKSSLLQRSSSIYGSQKSKEIIEKSSNDSHSENPLLPNFINVKSFIDNSFTIDDAALNAMVETTVYVSDDGSELGSHFIEFLSSNTTDDSKLKDPLKLDSQNVIEENANEIVLRKQDNYSEVLKTLQLSRDDSAIQCYSPKKFPLTEDADGVQFRTNQISPFRLSKTTDFDLCRKPSGSHSTYQDFEIKGCAKIELLDKSYKLKKNEFIKYQNGNVYRCENKKREALRENVQLKSARLLTKREVELRDDNNLIFTLTFDSSKDAKLFLESDKLSSYVNNDDHKSSVKKTLYRLLGKRSSREVLEKKGIYQNEPIFGNTLKDIYNNDRGIPKFILKTIELIERTENITSLGIYRTSGNLATIQKIRFEVDKGRLEILDDFAKDVDVLTGSLKLFFRELKEPLISCDACDQLLTLTKPDKQYTKKDKEKIKSVLHRLPEANWETLRVLLKHLTEVAKYKEQNKMDTYNLSVCWGPTVIFATETLDSTNYKDIVTQSTEATRMFESLLLFFINNPEELDISNRKQDSLDRNRNLIFRVDSKESVKSSDSNTSKGTTKRSGSNLSLDIDEVIRKMVELIEFNRNVDGLYKKPGVADKVSKINKKLTKKKLIELDKYKTDGLELCSSFKTYLQGQEPLVTRQVVEQVVNYCDNAHVREQNTRQKIILALQDLPKKDTFIFILKHILVILEHEPYHVGPRSEIISIWATILNHKRKVDSEEKFYNFLRIVLEAFDDRQPDIIGYPRSMNNGLLNDLRNHQRERDRTSKYDNVPDDIEIYHEAIFLEEKTDHLENTKL